MGEQGKPPYRVAVCIEVGDGHGRWQTLPSVFSSKGQAVNAGNALWVREAIPNLRGVRVLEGSGAQVGEDLFRS
jgi:hypothetical protein